MANSFVSRRQMLSVLAAAGGVGRLAPFLPASVYAAETPKRILSVFHPMGYLESSFWPTGEGGSSFTLGETMKALEPWKSKLVFPDGMYMYGGGWMPDENDNEHGLGMKCCFTGSRSATRSSGLEFSTGPSIEQAVADHQYAQVKTKFRALALGVSAGSGGGHNSVFHSKANTPVWAQNSPQAAFDSIFKDFTGPTAPATPNTPAPKPVDTSGADRLRKQRQSVLNMVRNDLNRLKGVSGVDDKQKVEAHLDGISSLENRLSTLTPMPAAAAVGGPAAPAGSSIMGCAKPTLRAPGEVVNSIHTQMDIIAAAFACDLTRTASLQLGGADNFVDLAGFANQHNTTHSSGGGSQSVHDDHKKWDRWYADRWAYLLGRLDAMKEGNGSVLDNTVIVFGSDTTTATREVPGGHAFHRFPLWTAGGGNFAFKTGLHIKLPFITAPRSFAATGKHVGHQRMLTSIARGFGMNVDKFGASDIGSGPMPGLPPV